MKIRSRHIFPVAIGQMIQWKSTKKFVMIVNFDETGVQLDGGNPYFWDYWFFSAIPNPNDILKELVNDKE